MQTTNCRLLVSCSLLVLLLLRTANENMRPCIFIGRPFVNAIGPLSVRLSVCLSVLSCLSLCDVGVLWPNGWMDQDEAWHAGRPRPQPHCD